MRRRLLFLLAFLVPLLSLGVRALGEEEVAPALSAVPDGVRGLLPDGVLEELIKGDEADPGTVSALLDGRFLFGALKESVKKGLSPLSSALSACVGILLLSAVLTLTARETGGETGGAARVFTTLLLALAIWKPLSDALSAAEEAIGAVKVFMGAMLPSMAALYAASGDLSACASEEGMLTLFFALVSFLVSDLLLPLSRLLFVMGITTRLSPENDLSGLTGAIRKTFLTSVTFLSVLLCAVLGFQHTLASRADGMLTRAVKFASATLIPVVGGTASEAMRTAMESVRFLRGAIGGLGVSVVLLLLFSPLAVLFLYKTGFSLSSGIAGALGSGEEAGFFREACGILDLALALVTLTGLVCLFALSVFIRSAAALGA